MTICRLLCCCGLLATAPLAAQDRDLSLNKEPALQVSGFAVGVGSYDRNLGTNTASGSKIALSLFRPWSDHLYLFGQLTTHLEVPDSGEAETHVELDNLIVNWTPPGASALTLSFGRFDASIGYERDDEPLNLIPTTSFNFELARPVKLTGLMARYTPAEMGHEEQHQVDRALLIQDTHVHVPMYGLIAAILSVVALGLAIPRWMGFALITLLFAAPWLDFLGMWLTKLVSPHFAVVTLAGGWAMGLGYTIVAALAFWQMWRPDKGVRT